MTHILPITLHIKHHSLCSSFVNYLFVETLQMPHTTRRKPPSGHMSFPYTFPRKVWFTPSPPTTLCALALHGYPFVVRGPTSVCPPPHTGSYFCKDPPITVSCSLLLNPTQHEGTKDSNRTAHV